MLQPLLQNRNHAPVRDGRALESASHLRVARLAVRALHDELACDPKPGLVSFRSSGSHADMDADTFMRSIQALAGYFATIHRAGALLQSFSALKALGLTAERQMLAATGGVNTHRGAIFSLGLLAAAAGRLQRHGVSTTAASLGAAVVTVWGEDILCNREHEADSHGEVVCRRYGVGGARLEAALGFPTIRLIALPAYERALADGFPPREAAIETLFAIMARLNDTNLLFRGGTAGLEHARLVAAKFLAQGGIRGAGWQERAAAIHDEFVRHRLSPGGCADILAATLFIWMLERGEGEPWA